MVTTRPEKVNELIDAAFDGMSKVADSTNGGEIISVLLSLALKGVIVAKMNGVDPQVLRTAIGCLLLECTDDDKAKEN